MINKIFSWILLIPALLPLLYIDGLLYPYITPKTVLLRGFGILAIAVFSYLALSGQSFYWGRLKQKISWLPAILLFVSYLTSWLGVDFYYSFWSTFNRGDGLLTLSIVIVFFYLVLLYADKKFFSKLVKTMAWSGVLVALYAFLQWVEVSSGIRIPLIEESRGRIGGTFGNAAFLAGYLGMTTFVTLVALSEYSKKWHKFLYSAVALQILVIFLTATRGTMLALLVVGFISLMYFALKKENFKARSRVRAALLLVIIFIGMFFVFRVQLSEFPFEPVRRIASISVEDSTVSSRLFVWNKVFQEALKSPFIGYGSENIDILFDRVYDPDEIVEQWFDRSHNSFLDYFVQYGIMGLLLYIGIIFSLGFTGWRMWNNKDRRGLYFVGLAIVYVVQNFFVFDTSMTLWLLFVFTAATLSVTSKIEKKSFSVSSFSHMRLIGGSVALILLILLIPVSVTPIRANLFLAQGYLNHIVDVSSAVDSMKKGFSLGTYANLEYGYQAYVMYTERQVWQLSGNDRVAAYKYTLGILTENFNNYPYDARTATYLAHVIDLAPPEVSRDDKLLLRVLDRAIELSPNRTQPWLLKVNIFIRKGDTLNGIEKINAYKEAILILEEYTQRVTGNAESRYVLANLYLIIGNNIQAKYWAQEGANLYKGSIKTARRAVRYYIFVEDWNNALRFSEEVVQKEPKDYESTYDLAKLYYMTGNQEMSLKVFERLKKEKPELLETDPEFLKAIKSIQK